MTDEKKSSLLEVIEGFARGALRTICLAYKDLSPNEGGPEHDDQDEKGNNIVEKTNMVCIAILGIRDIIRPEVPEAVRKCQGAGVQVRMVTGDNKITALAIAKECNIVREGDNMEMAVMEGKEFNDYVGGLI